MGRLYGLLIKKIGQSERLPGLFLMVFQLSEITS
jgi:hypothetical protein